MTGGGEWTQLYLNNNAKKMWGKNKQKNLSQFKTKGK